MSNVFGQHELALPFRSTADLLSNYRARDPNKKAIVDLDQGTSITFGSLDQATIDVAAEMKRRGVRHGDRVVLLADEVLEKLIIWLACWRIGAVICPLNIELNSEHVASLTALIGPKLVLVHKDLDKAAFTSGAEAPVAVFGAWSDDVKDADPADEFFRKVPRGADPASLPERNAPEDVSCMFCTSGTTSKPKIVVYDHAAYWLSGLSTLDILGLTEKDNTLEYRSFGWNSAQILSLLPFLQVGLTMHMAKRFSHSKFFEWIQKHELTFAAGVPTVVNMLLNKPLGYTAKDLPSLRLMTCSTAPLSGEQWARFEDMYGVTLLQLYGMSEAGWICGNRHYKRKIGTVGPPAKHQEFAIVNEQGEVCPPGVEGEVTIGGPQTAIGLLKDDGTIDPVRGLRIKTGDLAEMDDEGFVRVTGRTKDLIIRGGMNISPVEVDEVLLACPAVADAASVGVPDPIYGEEVVGFVILKPGATEAEVMDFCASKLPHAKRPKQIFVTEQLPKSDRGKVLRDKLREDWTRRTNANG
ncbi:MAG: class I adenylate-forming enzyme family protein [Beijerinckiaceae bacterium]|nr:class I adenylate-forming enzyme family protein [Beijerinckiaceae bacterium]